MIWSWLKQSVIKERAESENELFLTEFLFCHGVIDLDSVAG